MEIPRHLKPTRKNDDRGREWSLFLEMPIFRPTRGPMKNEAPNAHVKVEDESKGKLDILETTDFVTEMLHNRHDSVTQPV